MWATGLSPSTALVGDPTSSSRLFVLEQAGRVRVIVDGALQPTPFLDITTAVGSGGERGLLGMAFDPGYATNRRFYLYFTRSGTAEQVGDIVVARFTRSAANPLLADAFSRFDLRWASLGGTPYIEHSSASNHNGGNMAFGPDGYLYISVGDGGGGGDPDNNGQNPGSLLGKILRIDVDVPDMNLQGYQVPADNPFVDEEPILALNEIWAFGLRNPWKFSFDDPARGGTGALIIADVGQNQWEEINYELPGQGGRNYGWSIREGTSVFNGSITPAFPGLTDPVFQYFHSSGQSLVEGFSITGGFVYRGSDLSATWRGRYFFADFILQRIWSAQVNPATGAFSNIVEHSAAFPTGNVSSFGVDARGELYVLGYQGTVYRLCEVTATVNVASYSNQGGTGILTVATQPGCSWSVSGGSPWITFLSSTSGTGSAAVGFRIAANGSGVPRGATIVVGGQAIGIAQSSTPPVHGDIDGNGNADLIWQHDDGRLAAWLMNGTTLADGRPLGPGPLVDTAWRIVASGDFDRDGSRDIVFQHEGDGRLAVWLMSGTTLLSGFPLSPGQVTDTDWKVRAAADMDRDGWLDLIWQHRGDGSIAVWLMNGTTLRDGRLMTPGVVADTEWHIVGAGDMNGDGNPDLVWQHQGNGLISTWLMNGTALVSGPLLTPGQVLDTGWKIRAVTDLNGDARPDLIWQHVSSGLVSVWLMNGTTRVDGSLLSPSTVADTGWQIVGAK